MQIFGKFHALSDEDNVNIEKLILLGYTKQQTTQAYLTANRNVTKAADYLHSLKTFPDLMSHFMADLTNTGAVMGPEIIKLGDELFMIKDYKEFRLIKYELKAILNYDKAKLEKKVKKHWSSKVACKMVLVDQNKFPIQLAKLQANAYFKKHLAKCDATRFNGYWWG